jgi:hypothetical protein
MRSKKSAVRSAVLIATLIVSAAAGAHAEDPNRAGARPETCPGGTLRAHAPIVIGSDADWTAANGASGSGTQSDPYVISCLSITLGTSGTGISATSTTSGTWFAIRDVEVKGPGFASGNSATGISVGGNGNGTVEHVTLSGHGTGLNERLATIQVADDLLLGDRIGIWDTGTPTAVVERNVGVGSGSYCIERASGVDVSIHVVDNSCSGGSGAGFLLGSTGDIDHPHLYASGNLAQGNGGNGFVVGVGVVFRDNVARGNGWGLFLNSGPSLVEHNLIAANRNGGIDFEAMGTTVTNNTIVDNGGAGISANPANTQGFFSNSGSIVGNHIGGNPLGIAFQFGSEYANLVQDTDWTDGQQSIANFAYMNSIVDAGSDKVGAPGAPLQFSDYVAVVTFGPATPPASTTNPAKAYVATTISWDFGDGSAPLTLTDPAQGHGPPPAVAHAYANAGAYVARLTVSGIDDTNSPFTYSDSVPVSVA